MRAFGIFAGLAAAAIWGGMYVVSKVVLDVIPPFTLLTLRLILGAACLGAIILARGGFRATRRDWRRVLLVGVVGYGFSLGLQFTGTRLSTRRHRLARHLGLAGLHPSLWSLAAA